MSGFLLCQEPAAPRVACPEPFVCRASSWIDESNFGGPEPTRTPSGIRLRWNLPFIADDPIARGKGFPLYFDVYRSKPFPSVDLLDPTPTVGHPPRTIAPESCWIDMPQVEGGYKVSLTEECAEAQAVYCELEAGSPEVEVSVLDVNGATLAVAQLQQEDRYYLEASRIGSVMFSARAKCRIRCLAPPLNLDIPYSKIATVDARVWMGTPLDDLARRYARQDGRLRLTTDEKTWQALQECGRRVVHAHDNNLPLDEETLALQTAAALKWETAALLGWAFIDGEHSPGANHGRDMIVDQEMLQSPGTEVYAYQVLAHYPGSVPPDRSALHFSRATPMPVLTTPDIQPVELPSVVVQSVNEGKISGGTPIQYPKAEELGFKPLPDAEAYSCSVVYEVQNANPWVEKTSLQPWASASALTGTIFVPMGEFLPTVDTREPPIHRNMSVFERRRFNFEIPFVDSTVWLKVVAEDYWDRSLECPDTDPLLPHFDYAGRCCALQQVSCDGPARAANWLMDETLSWKGDRFSRLNPAQIELMGRRPNVKALEIEGEVGQISVHRSGGLQVELLSSLDLAQRGRLILGTLETSSLAFQILGFEQTGARTYIRLDATTACGAVLTPPIQQTHKALFRQSPTAEELWTTLGHVQVTAEGLPAAMSGRVDLGGLDDPTPVLLHSMLLHFATRLVVQYQGETMPGPITAPVAAPYVHDLPDTPDLCVSITQLGSDYYGRSFVRLEAAACDRFDERYLLRIACAREWIDDAAILQTDETPGILPSQAPFQEQVAFEAFEMLANCNDGDKFTAAITYVRAADGMAGRRLPIHFRAKENGG